MGSCANQNGPGLDHQQMQAAAMQQAQRAEQDRQSRFRHIWSDASVIDLEPGDWRTADSDLAEATADVRKRLKAKFQ